MKNFERLESKGEVLCPDEATAYRALSARANDLAMDRPDIAFATKELCREFHEPTRHSYGKLKRLARYLKGKPRLVWYFNHQEATDVLDVSVDTDFAGCLKTRRSTSGGSAMIGTHLLKVWSTTQTTVALSSGEAELSGIVRGASQALGLQSVAADLGMKLDLSVHTDSTAAIGMCKRRGLGKIRHLAVADLWIQDRVKAKDFKLLKVAGVDNSGDLMTKYVDGPVLQAHMARQSLVEEEGRAASAPQLPNSEKL